MNFKSPFPFVMAACALSLFALAGCGRQGASTQHTTAATSTSATSAASQTKQATFTIKGSLPEMKDGTKVTLLEMDAHPDQLNSSRKLATAKVENGSFTMTGSVDQPMRGMISWGPHAGTSLILENTDYQLLVNGPEVIVKGGYYNDKAYGYREMPEYVAALKKQKEAFRKAFAHVDEMDKAAMDAARKAAAPSQKAVWKIRNDYQAKILDGDAPALLKLFVLPDNYDWKRYPQDKRKAMYAAYEKKLGSNPVLQRMHYIAKESAESDAAQKALAVGKPYRDILAKDADGKTVKLSDVLAKNKLVLVDFWASWCGPCRGEFPHLAKTYAEFHKDGFEIYAVSVDDSRSDWLKALKEERAKNDIPWINLVDPGIDSPSAQAYGVQALPSNFLISGDGRIVGKNMKDWGVERAVRKQFGKLNHGNG